MKNLHWAIWGANEKVKIGEDEKFSWAVDIQIKHCNNEEEAILRAKEIIERKFYIIRSVIECDCAKHYLQQRKTLELNKEILELNKKHLGDNNNESNN